MHARTHRHLAFIAGLTLVTTSALPLIASAADTEEKLEEIVVVGSRIRRDTFNSPSPVQIITRDDTAAAGFSSTTDVLQSTSITSGASQINNAYGGFVTDGGPGANTISLRGLGASRTLVLINGRRVAPAGTRGAIGSADLNVLPSAMVDHIEVLRDGASSIYGSDAVAGVVNVVTMTNVKDLTAEVQYTRPFDDGGEETRVSLVGGLAGERWQVSGSAEFSDRSDLTLGQRDWTRCNQDLLRDASTGESLDDIDPLTGLPKCYPLSFEGSNGVTINTIGTNSVSAANFASLGLTGPPVGAPNAGGTSFNRFRPNSAVSTGVVGFEGVGGTGTSINVRDTFDPRKLNENIISPAKLYTVFVQGVYDLQAFGDAQLYAEVLAHQRESRQTGYRQLLLDYRLGSPLIPDNLAFSTQGPATETTGGEDVGVRAFLGFGNDSSSQELKFYKPMIGVRGNLFVERWKYDVNVSYSKSDASYTFQSALIDRMTNASDVVTAPAGTDPSLVQDGYTCRVNVGNAGAKCVPYPVLTSQVIGGGLTSAFRDYVWQDIVGQTDYDELVASAVIDGPVYELPAGSLQTVFGVEHRRAEIDDTPDPNSIAGNLLAFTSAAPTRGKDNVSEAFVEVEVPILKDLPFVNELTANGSFRYTDYESYGSDNTYKYGLMYSPLKWLSLRGTRGTSFRAPALYEQFQGSTTGFLDQSFDPCNEYGTAGPARQANCATELPGQPDFLQTGGVLVLNEGGAAAGLEAETSRNTTFGIVLQPPLGAFGDLSIAVDYFDIRITNGVQQVGAENILDRCYDDPQFRAGGGLCRLITRDPVTRELTVSDSFTNIATQVVKGLDYTIRFERPVGPGTARFTASATQYKSQASNIFPDEPLEEHNGEIEVPRWAAVTDAYYQWNKWQFHYGVEWVEGMDSYKFLEEDPATSDFDFNTGDYFVHNASVRFVEGSWEVLAGVRNLFDKEPPTISAGYYNRIGNAPLYSGFDYIGRRAFIDVSKRF